MERPRLLVVDDDADTRRALDRAFVRRGWEVTMAGSVAEALGRLDPAPECILLDMDLPDGGGEEVLMEVLRGYPRTRVFVCSGTEVPRQVALLGRMSPAMVVRKPVELDALTLRCEATLAVDRN